MAAGGAPHETLRRLVQSAIQTPMDSSRCTIHVGIDVAEISGFAFCVDDATTATESFLDAAYTRNEREFCRDHAAQFATRWAAKEAVVKAIGCGFGTVRPRDIEIHIDHLGRPLLTFGSCEWPEAANLWSWTVSLCHEADLAYAVAIAHAPIGSTGSWT